MLHKKKLGFTLVEIIITVSIITILGTVVIFSYGNFNDKLALSSAAQELAINLRQAQTYGINVKETSVGGGDFTKAYGIYFNHSNGNNDSYYLFIDKNSDERYNDALGTCTGTECAEKVSLRNGVRISSVDSADVPNCAAINGNTALHITFLRPNPDAKIGFSNGAGLPCSNMLTAVVTLVSPKGANIVININKTGQIEVR